MSDHDELRKALDELDEELEALKGMLKVAYATNNVELQKLVMTRVHQIGEFIKRHSDEIETF